jgi:ESS family glutamate:Na+ symporter
MSETMPMIYQVDEVDMLFLSILVLFFGSWLNQKIRFLGDNYIPPAVTGGLLFSIGSAIAYAYFDVQLEFDMRFRDLLLLVFFSTVGLSARFSTLLAGGRALVLLVTVAAVFLVLQDATGVAFMMMLGEQPGYGLMGGSVSLAGGHGTAIAWGAEAVKAGLTDAKEVGIAFATFGLICGGLLGGPVARYLINKYNLAGPAHEPESGMPLPDTGVDTADRTTSVLRTLMILAVCVSLGDTVNRLLFDKGVLLPGFLTAMIVAIAITNLIDAAKRPLSKAVVSGFGDVSLNIFLSMSMMSIQLWVLADGITTIFIVLAVQVLVMTAFATFIVFRLMGRDYDAVVIAAGFTGLGLGATPVAIANMESVTSRYGPSAKAFLVVPLVGAFFIDLLNATVIKLFIAIINSWLS